MELLLHVCCAPCSMYSMDYFTTLGYKIQGYFFNPNIHPYREFARRLEAVRTLQECCNQTVHYNETYPLEEFLRSTIDAEKDRCRICYEMRLKGAALYAAETGVKNFSTTLLLSPYQKHDLLKSIGEHVAASFGINFVYADLRSGFAQSMQKAAQKRLYRQSYCGCIFSEKERYYS